MTELEPVGEKPSNINIVKTRDDPNPVFFAHAGESTDDYQKFKLYEETHCSWVKNGEEFDQNDLRRRIEPWLTALCQSEHLSLLLGSGLTHAVHYIATNKPLTGMNAVDFGNYQETITTESKKSAENAGRDPGNIEDQIRTANELLRGLEILGSGDDKYNERAATLREKITDVLSSFAINILNGEYELLTAKKELREEAYDYLVSFLMSFSSRTGTRDRLNIFTTNYDRFIEAGAEVAGMHLLDRFVGSLAPIFRSSRLDLDMHYNPPGIRGEPRYLEGVAHFTKLHGSVDWVEYDKNIRRIGMPFGAKRLIPYIRAGGLDPASAMQLMIYPNSAKDRETAAFPYVDLFRDFAAASCRPNHTLIAFGYSFGDEHINRVIEDMLTIPSTHLVIIAFNDPLNRIIKTYDSLGRHAQISLLIGNHIGDFRTLVDHYLPKPAIDRTTFRMAELLKARWGNEKPDHEDKPTVGIPSGEGKP